MDINYELYKVFYYVASTLSFSEASKQLFISQSAVSQSIKALEKKLDQTLFIRRCVLETDVRVGESGNCPVIFPPGTRPSLISAWNPLQLSLIHIFSSVSKVQNPADLLSHLLRIPEGNVHPNEDHPDSCAKAYRNL